MPHGTIIERLRNGLVRVRAPGMQDYHRRSYLGHVFYNDQDVSNYLAGYKAAQRGRRVTS